MRRLRLIRPPQLGHKCFELKLSPCIAEIMTSAATHAVMAVTGLRFLVGTASLGRWGSQDLFIKLVRRSIRRPAGLLVVRASETGLSAYV